MMALMMSFCVANAQLATENAKFMKELKKIQKANFPKINQQ